MKIEKLTESIINGYEITYEKAKKLIEFDTELLLSESKKIRDFFCDEVFDLCTIINGKRGKCTENCKYCAQSVHYNCDVEVYDLLDVDTIVKAAQDNASKRIDKFSVVTSGLKLETEELQKITNIYEHVSKVSDIKLCASHGLLTYEELKVLKEAGVRRYHNNLETSRTYFPQICTTHTYEDKIETIKAAMKAGFEVCSGGIMGLGESMEDRLEMAFELKKLGVKSVPLNMLSPIVGTPLYGFNSISEEEFYKVCAVYRFIMPKATLRLAGGRGLLHDKGRAVFATCINGTISGELLTTSGNDTQNDIEMIQELGYKVKHL